MPSVNKYRIYCQTETTYVYGWYESEPSTCPNNTGHTINNNATAIVDILDSVGNFDDKGRLLTNTGAYTQFGEQRVSMYNPLFQNYALYNIINDQIYDIFTASGGSVTGDSNGTELIISITNAVGSYALVRSKKVCKYRPGYNLILRWNTVFDTPVANCLQFAGLGNNGSDVYFCYSGTDFGVRYSTDGFSEVRHLTVTAESSLLGGTRTATVVLNAVSYNVTLTTNTLGGGDANFTAYQIARNSYPGWLVLAVDNIVTFTSTDVGVKNGTYSYSSNGNSTGSFTRIKAGAALTTTFINRTSWNGSSRMVQDLDPKKRNMYAINFTWYGSGNMAFRVFNPDTSSYETVHTIKFANLTTNPSLSQPNMYLQQGVASLGSITSKQIKIAGGFAAVEGKFVINYPSYGLDNSKTISANTDTVIMAITARNNIFGFTNNSEILIRNISVSCDGNRAVKIKIVRNPATLSANTTTDYIRWKYINVNESISLYDTTSDTFTGDGDVLATYYLPKAASQLIDLNNSEITIFKGDIIIITALSTATSDIDAAITIVEDY